MSKIYQVTVSEVTPDPNGGNDYTTVLELLAPGEMLARVAPGMVAEILGAERAAVTVVMPQDVPTPDEVEQADAQGASEQQAPAEPTKRKRRTKAEIEADKQAQSEGYRDAAHKAEVLAAAEAATTGAGPTGDGDADLAAAEQAAVAAGVPQQVAPQVAADSVAAGVTLSAPPVPQPAPAVPGAPAWNPFAPNS